VRKRSWVAGGAVVAVAAVALIPRHRAPHEKPAAYATATATITRRSLTAQTLVDATLGYTGAYTVVNRSPGTITGLPAIGQVVRQGGVLYRVDGRPVILLYGRVPAYRALSYGMKGRDVTELNTALKALGHATGDDDVFGSATAYALERLQHEVGLPQTGGLPLGQAVFLPGAARITARQALPGEPVHPGAPLLRATSTRTVVTVALDAAEQTEVKKHDKVTITLPGGRTTPGVVSSVGRVAKVTKTASGDGAPTITVRVTPADPKATGGLDQAPVQVAIVTGGVRDALVVPVGALLAQAGGGYAVEVIGPRGNHLAGVSPGLFDDADGLVQVTGPGLSAGQRVVVPAT
jgi:hypothetical protein